MASNHATKSQLSLFKTLLCTFPFKVSIISLSLMLTAIMTDYWVQVREREKKIRYTGSVIWRLDHFIPSKNMIYSISTIIDWRFLHLYVYFLYSYSPCPQKYLGVFVEYFLQSLQLCIPLHILYIRWNTFGVFSAYNSALLAYSPKYYQFWRHIYYALLNKKEQNVFGFVFWVVPLKNGSAHSVYVKYVKQQKNEKNDPFSENIGPF